MDYTLDISTNVGKNHSSDNRRTRDVGRDGEVREKADAAQFTS